MSYKEVFVKAEDIQKIYGDFLEKIEPLKEQAEKKYAEDYKAYREWRDQEIECYTKAIESGDYWSECSYTLMYCSAPSHALRNFKADAQRMLNTIDLSKGVVLTQEQNERLLKYKNGEILSLIEKHLKTPYVLPESTKSKSKLAKPEPMKPPTPVNPIQHSGSFFNAMICIGGLGILICLLIKSCGG